MLWNSEHFTESLLLLIYESMLNINAIFPQVFFSFFKKKEDSPTMFQNTLGETTGVKF